MVAADEVDSTSDTLVFSACARWLLTASAVLIGASIVGGSALASGGGDQDQYVMGHALGAAPFLLAGLACTWYVLSRCPPEYRVFWVRWFAAGTTGVLATAAAVASVLLQEPAFLVLDMALIAAGVPLWTSAVLHMVRAQAGRWSMSVDVVDAATAVVVLGAPGVLLLAGPLRATDQLVYAVPFVLTVVLMPAVVYLSFVNLARIPRGERSSQGLGIALAGAVTANVTMQLARVVGDLNLPLEAVITVHVLHMGLLMVLPVWAHRIPTRSLPAEGAVRYGVMPYLSAGLLPLVGLYLLTDRTEPRWHLTFFCLVLLTVVVLNATRHTAMSRESRRLSAGLARMSEERRQLLASMLRGLDDDRRRTARELHSQALGSLAILGSLVQTAHQTLPVDTATRLSETVTQLQRDLGERAEELRQLMMAMRRPAPGSSGLAESGSPDNDALAAALVAFTSELYRERTAPALQVHIDPELQLDWSIGTIVYRIAQEALRDTARHASTSSVSVLLAEQDGGVVLEVREDGNGTSLRAAVPDPAMATMELFAHLGQGNVTVRPTPDGGRVVRSRLNLSDESSPGTPQRAEGRHLYLITGPDL